MKIVFILLFLIINYSCTPRSQTYWCGDHPCINKKEKEAYFKKTMTIEVKEDNKFKSKKESEIKKIMDQARLKEKERILNEKELTKQAKLEEKRRIKEEKEFSKELELDQKEISKNQKKKSEPTIKITEVIVKSKTNFDSFDELVEKINRRNSLRPFPDINDIPN